MTRAELELLVREEWCKVLKRDAVLRHLRRQTVDANDLVHREELLRLRVDANGAFDGVAGLEAVLTHLVFAHIDIVRAGEVVIVRRAKESVTVRRTFERTHGNHILAQIRNRQFFLLRLLSLCNLCYLLHGFCFLLSALGGFSGLLRLLRLLSWLLNGLRFCHLLSGFCFLLACAFLGSGLLRLLHFLSLYNFFRLCHQTVNLLDCAVRAVFIRLHRLLHLRQLLFLCADGRFHALALGTGDIHFLGGYLHAPRTLALGRLAGSGTLVFFGLHHSCTLVSLDRIIS